MALGRGFGSIGHLAGRFFGSLSRRPPAAADEAWALSHLLDGEQQLYRRMSAADQRHAIAVARRAVALLRSDSHEPDRAVVASALLHDVGKVASNLGPVARATVTVFAIVFGRQRIIDHAERARQARRPLRLAQQYLTHDQIGAVLLREAGSDPLTAAWAEEHHMPAYRWSIGPREGQALKAADDD
jgi:putative nucleotidyltransferase with HDIG domain